MWLYQCFLLDSSLLALFTLLSSSIQSLSQKLESDNSPAVSPGIGSGGGAGGGGIGVGIGGSINLINDSIGGIDGSSITGMLSTDRSQQQRLLQRSFLSKFEQDYMNPIFGGPDGVS